MPHLGDLSSNILLPPISKLATNMSDINLNGHDDGINGGESPDEVMVLSSHNGTNGHSIVSQMPRSPQIVK